MRNIRNNEDKSFEYLEGSIIIAHDGRYLGRIIRSKNNSESVINGNSRFGDKSNVYCILNSLSLYGGKSGKFSPFNPDCTSPPQIIHNGKAIAYLTLNEKIKPSVDPNDLLKWLENSK